jgi:hypothetical protein
MQTFLQSSIQSCQLERGLFTFDWLWGFNTQGRGINYAYRGLQLFLAGIRANFGLNGALAGYRWGVERKRALLEREGRV